MGLSDESCASPNDKYSELSPKVHLVKDIYIENGAGGGGGASYVFLVSHLVKDSLNFCVKLRFSF